MPNVLIHYKSLLIFTLSIFLITCSGLHKKANTELDEKLNTQNEYSLINSDKSFYNIPSPLQLVNKLKKGGYTLNINILNPYENYQQYTTSYKMALNFGIYAVDLAFLNSFNQLPESIKYFGTLKYLAEKLDLTVFFRQKTLKRLEQNISNNDSLYYMLAISLKEINYYLKTNERNGIANLILAGGWIESLHFLLNITPTKRDTLITDLISSQKFTAENIVKIISRNSYNTLYYNSLIKNFKEISKIYHGVTEEYTFSESTTDIKNKFTVINSSSAYFMSDSLMNELNQQVAKLRYLIISD